jgi:group I intron endonuclease
MSTISRTPSIYQIRHVDSGRVYVGSATNPRRRWSAHRSKLSRGLHDSPYLQSAWSKYGESAFVFEIIEPVLFVEDLVTREQYWIDQLHAADKHYGFNMSPTAGSTIGIKRTDETRARLSAAKRAEFSEPNARARLAKQSRDYWSKPESREKNRIKKQKDAVNPEIRAKMSAAQRANAAKPGVRERLSRQARAYFAANPAARIRASEYASVRTYILTDPDGNVYEIRNLTAFCRERGLTPRCFAYILHGDSTHHKGWTCRYKT